MRFLLLQMVMLPLMGWAGVNDYSFDTGEYAYYGTKQAETIDVCTKMNDSGLVGKTVKQIYLPLDRNNSMVVNGVWIERTLDVADDGSFNPVMLTGKAKWQKGVYTFTLDEPFTLTSKAFYVGLTVTTLDQTPEAQKPFSVCAGGRSGAMLVHGSVSNHEQFTNISNLHLLPMHIVLSGDEPAYAPALTRLDDLIAIENTKASVSLEVCNRGFEPITSLSGSYQIDGGEPTSWTLTLPEPIAPQWNSAHTVELEIAPLEDKGDHSLTVDLGSGKPLTATVTVGSFCPKKRTLVEEYTNLYCGNCPRGLVAMEEMTRRYPNEFIALSYHSRAQQDPMGGIANGDWPVSGSISFPMCELDRVERPDIYMGSSGKPMGIEQDWLRCQEKLAMADVSAVATLKGDSVVEVTAATTFVKDVAQGYKLACFLVADDLHSTTWDQLNYYSSDYQYADDPYLAPWVELPTHVFDHHYNDIVIASPDTRGSLLSEAVADVPLETDFAFVVDDVRNCFGEPIVQNASKLRVVVALLSPSGEVENAAQTNVTVEPSAIADCQAEAPSTQWYNLMGRKCLPKGKGIFVNSQGKKIIQF